MSELNPLGRPTVMTPEIIDKLEEAFIMGSSDLEACLTAGIGKTTLYEYQKLNPDFAERKELLKNSPTLRARRTIAHQLEEGDVATAKWYLERKKKDEFSTSADLNLGGQNGENPIITRIERVIIDPKVTNS